MKVKLDLHTHIWEASGFEPPNVEWAEKVVRQAKAMGIDGIALTEHRDKEPAFAYKEIFDRFFPGELLVFPGWETEIHPPNNHFQSYEVGEFLLPNGTVFRNYCHPGHPARVIEIDNMQSIEIDNKNHNWHIDKAKVEAVALEYGLLLTRVSDAHALKDIGTNYTEVDLDDFISRGVVMEGWDKIL